MWFACIFKYVYSCQERNFQIFIYSKQSKNIQKFKEEKNSNVSNSKFDIMKHGTKASFIKDMK